MSGHRLTQIVESHGDNVLCNIQVLGSKGKSLCICVLCVILSHCLFLVF